jgi:diguanylate cyclase (GGDEF)-like protein
LVRVGFAICALLFAPRLFQGSQPAVFVFAAYLVLTLGFQFLIHKRYGQSDWRSSIMGAADIGFLTYAVYLLGPASSVLPFVYLLIPVLNAASSPSRGRVAMRLAALGSLAYSSVLLLTGLGILEYAPARVDGTIMPAVAQLLASGLLVALSVVATTSLVLRQMTALDRMNRRLSELSQRDDLTGLYNRRTLGAVLSRQLERVQRGAELSVMMIDLDGFKAVNDQQGHDCGDALLREVAHALGSEIRSIDLAARYGGDEFVIVLPDVEVQGAMIVAQRIVQAISAATAARCASQPVTASVGVTGAESSDTLSSLLRRADLHAYAAKRAGGNRALCGTHVPSDSGVMPQAQNLRARRSG